VKFSSFTRVNINWIIITSFTVIIIITTCVHWTSVRHATQQFLPCDAMQSAAIAGTWCPSVCLSVCLSDCLSRS